eukprot:3168074-Rhodomonas_salina.1
MAQYAQYGVYEQAGYGGGYGQQYVEQPAYGGYAQQEAYPAPQLYTEAYPQAAMPVEYEYVVQQPPQMMAQPAMVSTMPVYEEPQVMPMTPQRQMPPPQPQYEQYSVSIGSPSENSAFFESRLKWILHSCVQMSLLGATSDRLHYCDNGREQSELCRFSWRGRVKKVCLTISACVVLQAPRQVEPQ